MAKTAKKVAIQPLGDKILVKRLEAAEVQFILPPRIRFRGQPGEQATMFLRDPSGNALEFKAFENPAQLFATD